MSRSKAAKEQPRKGVCPSYKETQAPGLQKVQLREWSTLATNFPSCESQIVECATAELLSVHLRNGALRTI